MSFQPELLKSELKFAFRRQHAAPRNTVLVVLALGRLDMLRRALF
jgi:hypothetical protein